MSVSLIKFDVYEALKLNCKPLEASQLDLTLLLRIIIIGLQGSGWHQNDLNQFVQEELIFIALRVFVLLVNTTTYFHEELLILHQYR